MLQDGTQQESEEPVPNAKIVEVIMQDETFAKYTCYQIEVGDGVITRRYRDFHSFHNALKTEWPGFYIPPIPQKQAMGNMNEEFIRARRRQLEQFLQNLMKRKYLWNSQETRLFLKSENIGWAYDELPQLNVEGLLRKYSTAFPEFMGKEATYETKCQVNDFQLFIHNVRHMIENFRKMSSNFLNAKENYSSEYGIFVNYVLPEYEKMLVPSASRRFFDGHQHFTGLGVRSKNLQKKFNYDAILIDLQNQESEVIAFQAAFDQIKKFQDKQTKLEEKLCVSQQDLSATVSHKRNLFSKMLYGSKDKEVLRLTNLIEQAQREIQDIQMLVNILQLLMAQVDIPEYRAEKQHNFYKLLKIMGTLELEQIQFVQNYWKEVLNSKQVSEVYFEQQHMMDSVLVQYHDDTSQKQQAKEQNSEINEVNESQQQQQQQQQEQQYEIKKQPPQQLDNSPNNAQPIKSVDPLEDIGQQFNGEYNNQVEQ